MPRTYIVEFPGGTGTITLTREDLPTSDGALQKYFDDGILVILQQEVLVRVEAHVGFAFLEPCGTFKLTSGREKVGDVVVTSLYAAESLK